jgi:hypothetical protein
MRQKTPQSWGRVYWGGGAGKPGEKGGWRIECNFCTYGRNLLAIARRPLADRQLGAHVMEQHAHKTEVRALMQNTTGGAKTNEAPASNEGEEHGNELERTDTTAPTAGSVVL